MAASYCARPALKTSVVLPQPTTLAMFDRKCLATPGGEHCLEKPLIMSDDITQQKKRKRIRKNGH